MKKLILLLIVIVSMSGCVVIPGRLHHEKRIQMYRNYPRQYYYHYPLFQERIFYIPYFRLGRY